MESPTATELPLPGLEARVVTDPSPEHFIERGPLKRLMVFAGRSHPDLAQNIAEKLGVELGDVELETFSNGETYCRYLESIRGADVFIVQTGVGDVDSYLMELVFMIQAAKLASAKTFMIASASRPETLRTVMLSGRFRGSTGTLSVTTMRSISDSAIRSRASSEKSACVTNTKTLVAP